MLTDTCIVCDLPVQEPSLHGIVSLGGHGFPPSSAGCVMLGSRLIVPSPQVALHSLNGFQFHSQSTILRFHAKRFISQE